MDTSLFLAQLIGPISMILGFSFLIHAERIRAIFEDFRKSAGELYLVDLATLIAGLSMILVHNVWTADWRVVITLIGWMAFIKGISLALWPSESIAVGEPLVKNSKFIRLYAVAIIAFGAWLSWVGYLAG